MTAATEPLPPARIAGLCYLLVIAGGVFAGAVVIGPLAGGDPGSALGRIAANPTLWRTGIAVHLGYLLLTVPLGVILYRIFRPVQPVLALCALVFSLFCPAIEAMSLVGLHEPLALMRESGAALDLAARAALADRAIASFSIGFAHALLFFAGYCVLTGVLILKSALVPRPIGALMVVAGLCYLANSMAVILSPPLADRMFPWILLPCLLAETSLALWLATMGVHRVRWHAVLARSGPPVGL